MTIHTERLRAHVEVDTKKAQADLIAFRGELDSLVKGFGKSKIKIDTELKPPSVTEGKAQKKMVEKAIGPLNIKMRVDQSSISAITQSIKARLASAGTIDLSKANFSKGAVSGIKNLTSGFMGLAGMMVKVAGIAAVVGAALQLITGAAAVLTTGIGALVGVLAVLPSFLAAIAQGAAAGIVAFRGIGTALSAYGEAQASGAKNTKALRQAMDAEEQAARSLTRAQRSLRNAKESQARGAEDAAERIERAERNLIDAQEDALTAQERLTRARDIATERLEDLRLAAQRAALSEAQAGEAIIQAQQRLMQVSTDPNASASDLRAALLDVKDAELRLKEVQEDRKDIQEELTDREKKGIEASDEVKDALRTNEDITLRLADAQRELQDSIRDQARQQRDSAEAVEEAMHSVTEAQKNFAEASQQASSAAAGGLDEYKKAMDNLSPSARAFVEMINGFRDQFKLLRLSVQEAFFEGLAPAISTVVQTYLPMLQTQLTNTAVVLRGVVQDFASLSIQPGFMAQVSALGDLNVGILRDMGDGLINLVQGMVGFMTSAAPFVEWFSGRIVAMTERFNEWANSAGGQSAIGDFLNQIRPLLTEIGNLFSAFGTGFMEIAKLLIAPTTAFLQTLLEGGHIVDFFAKVGPAAIEVLTAFSEAIGKLGPSLGDALVSLSGPLVEAFVALGEELPRLIPHLGELAVLFVQELVPILPDIVDLLIQMTRALIILTPILMPLIQLLLQLLNALGPVGGLVMVLGLALAKLGLLGTVLTTLGGVISTVLAPIGVAVATLAAGFGISFGAMIAIILAVVAAVVGLAIVIVKNWDTIKRWTGAVWDWIYNKISGFVSWLSGVPGMIWRALGGMWDWLYDGVSGAVQFVYNTLGGMVNWFGGLPGTIWDIFTSVGKAIMNPFLWAFDQIARLWNSTIGSLRFEIPGWIPGIGGKGWAVPDLPRINFAQKGGVFSGAGNVIVGENGPELLTLPRGGQITPLNPSDMPAGMHGGNTYIEVKVAGSVLTEGQLIEKVRRGLTREGTYQGGGILAGVG